MYSRREKSSSTLRAPASVAEPYASISASSDAAVTSPRTSITLVAPSTGRTAIDTASCVMPSPFVVEDGHEVRQPRDPEDLAVVIGQATGLHLASRLPGFGQQADDEGDAGRVDVVDAAEVQDQHRRVARLPVRAQQLGLRAAAHVPRQLQHGGVPFAAR